MSTETAGDAATLIGYALRRTHPGRDSRHRRLLDRYQTDVAYRVVVDAVADGLGLDVVDATDAAGLVLAPQPGSVFDVGRVDELSGRPTGVKERLLLGLAVTGIAAWCYPSPARLESRDLAAFALPAVGQAITRSAETMLADSGDGPVDEEAHREAWREWVALDPTNPTATGRETRGGSHLYYLQQAVKVLADADMVTDDPDVDGRYLTTDRFRVYARQAGSNLALTMMRAANRTLEG